MPIFVWTEKYINYTHKYFTNKKSFLNFRWLRNMKNTKIYLVGFILILYFSFILQGTNNISNEQVNKENRNVVPPLTISNSLICDWNRTWGGADDEGGYRVAVDSSGNVYISGSTESFGMGLTDMVLVKYDGNGVQQWNRTWGGAGYDLGYGVAVDSSGNVYLVGGTMSFGAGGYDIVLVKYDGNGGQQWNRTWGAVGGELGYEVAVDSSGNVYLSGLTGSIGAGGYGVAVDSSGNVYLVGRTQSFGAGGYDIVLVKYDGNGGQQWNRTWGGADDDDGIGVAVDSSGNVYLSGLTGSIGAGGQDMVLVKYDGNGVQQWNRVWGGADDDGGSGVTVDSSGNVYLVGRTQSFGAGFYDMVLVKYDGNGVQQWNRMWGGADDDDGSGVAVDSSGNVYLSGSTMSFGVGGEDMVLVKYSQDSYKPTELAIPLELILMILIISGGAMIGVATIMLIRRKRKRIE